MPNDHAKPAPDGQETNLGRISACIYCGATDDLTDEHVIPKGLGGPAVLYDASCRSCAKTTSAFERLVLRDQLGAFRVRMGLPTRRPKTRPTEFPARVRRGTEWEDVRLPMDKFTAIGAFPRFPLPSVVARRAPGEGIRIRYTGIAVVPHDGIGNDPPRRAGVDAVEQTVRAYPGAFMQVLAKIAWGFSVSLFGLHRLDPAILGVIHGTDPDPDRWVGFPPPETSGFDAPAGLMTYRFAFEKLDPSCWRGSGFSPAGARQSTWWWSVERSLPANHQFRGPITATYLHRGPVR
jgi:hypothetical protein